MLYCFQRSCKNSNQKSTTCCIYNDHNAFKKIITCWIDLAEVFFCIGFRLSCCIVFEKFLKIKYFRVQRVEHLDELLYWNDIWKMRIKIFSSPEGWSNYSEIKNADEQSWRGFSIWSAQQWFSTLPYESMGIRPMVEASSYPTSVYILQVYSVAGRLQQRTTRSWNRLYHKTKQISAQRHLHISPTRRWGRKLWTFPKHLVFTEEINTVRAMSRKHANAERKDDNRSSQQNILNILTSLDSNWKWCNCWSSVSTRSNIDCWPVEILLTS